MSEVEGGVAAAAAADSDADAEEGVQETLEDEMTIKRPAVTFPTCKQSERGAYRSNNKLLGINDHMAAEHNSTSLICMGAHARKRSGANSVQHCYKIRTRHVLLFLYL